MFECWQFIDYIKKITIIANKLRLQLDFYWFLRPTEASAKVFNTITVIDKSNLTKYTKFGWKPRKIQLDSVVLMLFVRTKVQNRLVSIE